MSISLQTRHVGAVVVVTCSGKIVSGAGAEELQQVVGKLLPLEPSVVLNVAEVTSLDSFGVGVLVRLLHRTRSVFGDLKLCCVPPRIAEVLRITRLAGVFDVHSREEEAIAAFYGQVKPADARATLVGDILCVDESPDVLAYICAVLREAGYRVMQCGNVSDAAVVLKVSRPRVLVIGSSARANSAVSWARPSVAVSSRLLRSLASWPEPRAPTCTIGSPNADNTGTTVS